MPKPEEILEQHNIDYESMTVTELKEECKNRGLSGYSNLNKEELIKLLRE